jgi:hypothetical protein
MFMGLNSNKKQGVFMKKFFKMFGIIALAAIIGFSLSACKDDDDDGLAAPTGLTATPYSSSGIALTWNPVSGATGYKVYNGLTSTVAFVGNVSSNSAYNINLPANTTVYFKVSAYNSSGEGPMSSVVSATTLSAGNTSLNGVWVAGMNSSDPLAWVITISGNTGALTKITPIDWGDDLSKLWNDAMNKGYVTIGTPYWRNITSTGNLTWSGEILAVTYSGNNTIATGISYKPCSFIMSADGLKISDNGTNNWTHIRK